MQSWFFIDQILFASMKVFFPILYSFTYKYSEYLLLCKDARQIISNNKTFSLNFRNPKGSTFTITLSSIDTPGNTP